MTAAEEIEAAKAALIEGFVPEDERKACAEFPLSRIVQHAVEHHEWHHEQEGRPR